MFLRFNIQKNNKGSSAIIVALTMTVILGLCGIVTDIGLIAAEKHKMQNAIDATALAAAHELPNVEKAKNVAVNYIKLNGYEPADITISFSNSNKEITLNCTDSFEYKFAKLLGFDSTTLAVSATALCETIGGPFNYALFSGSKTDTLNLNGSDFYVDGSAHSNYKVFMTGSGQIITGVCEASSTIRITSSNNKVNTRIENAPVVEMPDFSGQLIEEARSAGQVYTGDQTFTSKSLNVDKPIYVDGNLTITTSKFTGNGVIIATGDIIFNGSNLKTSKNNGVCFYSINGSITINGSNAVLDGIVYAPKGIVTMNGSNQVIYGRVVAHQAPFNGGNSKIISGTYDLKGLPTYDIKLIK